MVKMVFDGPGGAHRCLFRGMDYLFERGGLPTEVPEELAEELLTMNPRNLPVEREGKYDGPLAGDYGMLVFHRYKEGEKIKPYTPPPPVNPHLVPPDEDEDEEGGDR